MQIFVLGMHRSGTSAVARLLNIMGAYWGPEGSALAPAANNPKGFGERRDVMLLNDALLTASGCSWQQVVRYDFDKIPAAVLVQHREEAKKLIHDLDMHRPWMLKDPRLCLLFPFWKELVEVPLTVFVLRNPLAVARSLQFREGFSLATGLALWEFYTVSALRSMSGAAPIIVDFEGLIKEPASSAAALHGQLNKAGVALRMPSEGEIRSFIETGMVHHCASEKEMKKHLTAEQLELYRDCLNGSAFERKSERVVSQDALEVLAKHDQYVRLIQARTVDGGAEKAESEEKIKALNGRISEMTVALKRYSEERRDLTKANADQRAEIQRLGDDRNRLTKEVSELKIQMQRLADEKERLWRYNKETRTTAQRYADERNRLIKETADLKIQQQRQSELQQRHTAANNELRAEIKKLTDDSKKAADESKKATDGLRGVETELERFKLENESLKTELNTSMKAGESVRRELEREVKEKRTQLANEVEERRKLERRIAALTASENRFRHLLMIREGELSVARKEAEKAAASEKRLAEWLEKVLLFTKQLRSSFLWRLAVALRAAGSFLVRHRLPNPFAEISKIEEAYRSRPSLNSAAAQQTRAS